MLVFLSSFKSHHVWQKWIQAKTKNSTVTTIIIKNKNWISIPINAVLFFRQCFWFESSTSQPVLSPPVPCHSYIFITIFFVAFNRFWEVGSPIKSLLLLTVVRQRRVGGSGLTLPTTPLFPIEPSPAQDGTDKKRRWQDRTDEVHQSLGWWVKSHIYMILLLFYSKKKCSNEV